MTKNDPMVEKNRKKRFFGYIYENYSSGRKMFVHKVEEREKCYFFLHKPLAPKLWKILTIIDLGPVLWSVSEASKMP